MSREQKTVTVVHLDDRPQDRHRVKKRRSELAKAFNNFYRKNFVISGSSPRVDFTVRLEQIGCADALKHLLLDENDRPTGSARDAVLFLLDYRIPQQEGGLPQIIGETLVDGMPVPVWLDCLFPATLKVYLTVESVKNMEHVGDYHVLKPTLDHPTDFRVLIESLLDQHYGPSFARSLLEYGAGGARWAWHTPGHMLGSAFQDPASVFQKTMLGSSYGEMIFRTDLSVSVSSLGDLSEPERGAGRFPLGQAQRRTARIFGAEDTYYITNGTSTSNKALLMTVLRPGDVVLVDRNCHKSIHQAIVVCGAYPVYLPNEFNDRLQVWSPLDFGTLRGFIAPDSDEARRLWETLRPRMLILTTCTYEGVLYPVHQIAQLCEEQGVLFHADEAWAPHLRFHPLYARREEESMGTDVVRGDWVRFNALDGGAHLVVQSTHKILAAFSQASMIHVGKRLKCLLEDNGSSEWEWFRERFSVAGKGSYAKFRHDLHEVLRYWHSTSPFYPMMATLDCAAVQMAIEGTRLLDDRITLAAQFACDANALTGGCMVELADIVREVARFGGYTKDPLKLVLAYKSNYAGRLLRDALRREGIQWEKDSGRCLEFLVTLGTREDHVDRLIGLVRDNSDLFGFPESQDDGGFAAELAWGQVVVKPHSAVFCATELVPLDTAVGRICAQMLVPYPPGIPIFLPGLRIEQNMVDYVNRVVRDHGASEVHGLFDAGQEQYHVKVVLDQSAPEDESVPAMIASFARMGLHA